MLNTYYQDDAGYDRALERLSRRGDTDMQRVEPAVRQILEQVRTGGDTALRALTERFEQRSLGSIALKNWQSVGRQVSSEVRDKLSAAAARIKRYHEHQREPGFRYLEDEIELGQRVRPLASVAVYAPGGKARYPSTVLMTAVPATVAGVPRIVLATPNPSAELLAAAEISGVTEVVDCGGAQAIAAVAYGTESIKRVDKIVGPGNIYVNCAKRLVFGVVGIDSLAGPSEILVIADEHAPPDVVAADLLSQAEHDQDAYPLLVVLSGRQADSVSKELERQLALLPRREIASQAMRERGACFVVRDLAEAARVADRLAPEHLSLTVRDPARLLESIGAAGAVFLGDYTPEAAGDYAAGPSHVLPTGGAARFSSALGVYDFITRSSLIGYSKAAIQREADLLESLALLEGFDAHARAVKIRRV
jgi:histidinol dehydrogenase